MISLVDYLPRRRFLIWSFAVLAGLLVVVGSIFIGGNGHGHGLGTSPVMIILYALCLFVVNLGEYFGVLFRKRLADIINRPRSH